MTEQTCVSCRHWHRLPPNHDTKMPSPDGFCQRFPPTRGVDGKCYFPAIGETYVCGEYSAVTLKVDRSDRRGGKPRLVK